MAGPKSTFYWDTCVFLAWIRNEIRPAGEMEGVREYVDQIDTGKASLVTSVITISEMLECRIEQAAAAEFRRVMDRSNVLLVDVTYPIAELASVIRNYYQLLDDRDGQGKIATPDAIHLATAIVYECSEFNTFDDGKKDKDARSLLGLGTGVADHPLLVRKPAARPKPAVTQLELTAQ